MASVAGAVVGHYLGKRFGRPLLYRIAPEDRVLAVEKLFQKYGAWAILVAAFTPLPYKVFAILAGILDMNRRRFVVASLIGRGARFFLLGGLIFVYGDSIEGFTDRNFTQLTIALGVGSVVVVGLGALYAHRRRARNAAS